MLGKIHIRALATVGVSALVLSFASPASAAPLRHPPHFTEVDQVSNLMRQGVLQDTNVVNAWGLALGPDTPLWVANNGTNTATVYSGGVNGEAVEKVPLTVTIPGGAPTGAAFNDTDDFVVHANGRSAPATFLFVSEGGDVTAWSATVSGTTASVVAHVNGAVYKGLALLHTKFGPFLLATDFLNERIDVFDKDFHRVNLGRGFRDPNLPDGYSPFNVYAVRGHVFVSYAFHEEGDDEETPGPGLGIVDDYTKFGLKVERVASHGTLDAPWGMAIAPRGFGKFSGALLVGNFGDGRINVYRHGRFLGQVSDAAGRPITIDGLWALLPGTATTGGTRTVWFSAGPDEETNGLVGQLIRSR